MVTDTCCECGCRSWPRRQWTRARAGDDLIVTVGPHRRVLTLPSGLRRCEIVGGEFVNRELRIRFRPDPAVWRRT